MSALIRAGALAAAIAALAPATTLAHEGDPNFRSEIRGLDPAVEGIDVSVLNFDDSLRLRNASGQTVVVEGYDEEPYVRIAPDGTVEVNRLSPAYYLNGDRYADADVPPEADPTATPDWKVVDRSGEYDWHDHRAHYMGEGTPPQVTDEAQRTKVFDYEVPLRVDDRPVTIEGDLFWVGTDEGLPPAPFVALGVGALAAVALVVVVRRRRATGDRPREGKEAW
jgi:hypothetical protein